MKRGDTALLRVAGRTVQDQIDAMFAPNPFDGTASDSVIWMTIRETAGLEGLRHQIDRLKDIPAKEGMVRVTDKVGKVVTFEWVDGSGVGQAEVDRLEVAHA